MKKTIKRVMFAVAVLSPLAAEAQQLPQMPLDPAVRYGKLDNGLTYYIRHNELPKDRAEFYIVQKVGSILEEENQRGLAHFLEHMAFNGTKNFPGKAMLNYLEQNGVKFGTNVNAYTAIDETVYNLSEVPTTRWGLVDSCLLILHDWSGFITLDGEEIDAERGVIHEEWRTRSNSYLRMYEGTVLPTLFPNNRYGQRMPIGLMEVVDNFPYQDLRDYYHKWYRPDLQGVIIVGDVNVDSVETRIRQLWADIPAPVNPAERTIFEVADNAEPIVCIATDKETPSNGLTVMYKRDVMPRELKGTQAGLYMGLVDRMISMMSNDRYDELMQKADAPFLSAGTGNTSFLVAPTKDVFQLSVRYKEGEWQKGLNALMDVAGSIRDYGFTQQELDRAKANLRTAYEHAYNERDKVHNPSYVSEYQDHFLENIPAPGIEVEYPLTLQALDQITLEQVNQIYKSYLGPQDGTNLVLLMMGVDKEGVVYPTEAELLAAYNEALARPTTPYEETFVDEPLITKLPKAGKVKKQESGDFGTTIWTLSNGAKVIIKPTDFKKDQISMSASSPGGQSLIDEKDAANMRVMGKVLTLGGVGNLSATDLGKALAGKHASASPYVGSISEGINGACSPRDLETMLQLTYLYFTAPRKDAEAYEAFKQKALTSLRQNRQMPDQVLSDSIVSTFYGNNPRRLNLTPEMVEAADYDRILELYRERFANAADFTFVFVGNVDADTLRPLVEQYIASLPAKGKKEQYKEVMPRVREGQIANRFTLPMTTPKVTVINDFSGQLDYTLYNRLRMTVLSQVMSIVFTETIREQEGGTYGVGTYGSISFSPKGNYSYIYQFDTSEDKVARLEERAYEELARVAQDGPKQEMFDKVMGYLRKKHEQDVKDNGYWGNVIDQRYRLGIDDHSSYDQTLDSITPASIQELAKTILSSGNRIEIVSTGVEMK